LDLLIFVRVSESVCVARTINASMLT